jgi:lyso-ornithine lipid O-acyltransferase
MTAILKCWRRGQRSLRLFFALVWTAWKLAMTVRLRPESERSLYRAHRQRLACRQFCRILGVRVTQVGQQPEAGAMIVVANHHGILDPWILASVLPVAFAAKAEMASWPVMGWVCRTVGIVFVERDRRMATTRFVEELQAKLRTGVRVLVFPEGTTGDGRTIRQFKTAGFASVAGMEDGAVLPVYHVPVRLDGQPSTPDTRQQIGWIENQPMAESAYGFLDRDSIEVEVRIGAPIATAGRDRKELARLSREAMQALAGEMISATTR